MGNAFNWVKTYGICADSAYPYVAGDGHCSEIGVRKPEHVWWQCMASVMNAPISLQCTPHEGLRPVPGLHICCHDNRGRM